MNNELITQISIIGSLAIAAITVIINVLVAFINKRYEYRQAMFKTIIDCAYREYEHRSNLVKELAEKNNGTAKIVPFTEYLFFYSRLVPVLHKKRVKEKDMEKACTERMILVNSFYNYTDKYKPRETGT